MVWASEGCWVNSSHDNITVCKCNHTTSYGLLMDVHQVYVSVLYMIYHFLILPNWYEWFLISISFCQDDLHETHKEALKYISLIGCSISIVFCFLTVLALTLAMWVSRETLISLSTAWNTQDNISLLWNYGTRFLGRYLTIIFDRVSIK